MEQRIIWQPDAMPEEEPKQGKQYQFLTAGEDWVDIDGGKGSGKRLWIDTLIPTPSGFVKMGDIKVGDKVFDEAGNVCGVTYTSPVALGDSYKVCFSDGSIIYADKDHLWSVETQETRGCSREPVIMTTGDMVAGYAHRSGHSVPWKYSVKNTLPLNLPTAELPIDPYILGLWLGDGNSRGPIITTSEDDEKNILDYLEFKKIQFTRLAPKKAPSKARQVYINNLKVKLKKANLLLNKHIPNIYLRSSQDQRSHLLCGLMDSDGHAGKLGHADFYNTNEVLIQHVAELIASLGMKCSITSKRGMFRGKEYKRVYTIRFSPIVPVFKLARKLNRIKYCDDGRELRRSRRFIVNIESVEPLPMRCISVDSPSHLYLAGRSMIATHNSDLLIFDCMRNEKLNDPRWLGVIFRREYKRLAELMDRSKYWFGKIPQLGAHWQGEHNRFVFPRGGRLAFHNVENPGDEEKYQGWEICDLKFDQLEEFPETIFDYLLLQNRSGSQVRPTVRWTANPIGEGRCVPYGDVLTLTGWKRIQDVSIGERVATLDDDGKIIYAKVDQTYADLFYDGELLEHKTVTSHIICTPNHKIARGTETKNKSGRTFHKKIVLTRADELPEQSRLITNGEWIGEEIKYFILPEYKTRKLRNKQPDILSGDDYCELMGWFLSEGYTIESNKGFGITQAKPQNIPIIRDLFVRCGFKFNEQTKPAKGNRMQQSVFTVYSPRWWNYLKQFGKCTEKFIPETIKNTTRRQMKLFVESAMLGDGDANWKYYTTSKVFADNMQEIAMKLGYNSYLKSRLRINRSRVYEVKFKFSQQAYVMKSKIEKKRYSGAVYCIGIDTLHRFFIRQNGRVWLSGNSWIKRRFIDNKTPGQTYEIQQDVRGVTHTLTYKRIFATVFDNPVLKNDARYIATLANTRSPELRKAFLEGDWNVSVGQFFYDFMDSVHVIPSRELPREWNRLGGFDYGKHKVLTIVAADDFGNIFVEWAFHSGPYLHGGRMRTKSAGEFAEDSAEWMLKNDIGEGLTIIGDIDLFQMKAKDIGSTKTSVQIIQEIWNKRFRKAGRKPPIIFRVVKKGNENYNYRAACNEAVKDYLRFKTDELYNILEQPRLFIFDRITGLRTTLPELVGDPDDPLDFIQYKGEAKNDHDFDSFKMPFMQIFQTKEMLKAEEEDESEWYKQLYGHLTTRALKNPLKPSGKYRR